MSLYTHLRGSWTWAEDYMLHHGSCYVKRLHMHVCVHVHIWCMFTGDVELLSIRQAIHVRWFVLADQAWSSLLASDLGCQQTVLCSFRPIKHRHSSQPCLVVTCQLSLVSSQNVSQPLSSLFPLFSQPSSSLEGWHFLLCHGFRLRIHTAQVT